MKLLIVAIVLILSRPVNLKPTITSCTIETSRPSMGYLWNKAWETIAKNELNNLKFHYNGVIAGKWGLSPKYESITELEQLIKEKEQAICAGNYFK